MFTEKKSKITNFLNKVETEVKLCINFLQTVKKEWDKKQKVKEAMRQMDEIVTKVNSKEFQDSFKKGK